MKLLPFFLVFALESFPLKRWTDPRRSDTVSAPTDTLAEAEKLRNSGQIAQAAHPLQPYWANHNGDRMPLASTARPLLAETIRRGAHGYEVGVRANPGDLPLALSFGRMLIERAVDLERVRSWRRFKTALREPPR